MADETTQTTEAPDSTATAVVEQTAEAVTQTGPSTVSLIADILSRGDEPEAREEAVAEEPEPEVKEQETPSVPALTESQLKAAYRLGYTKEQAERFQKNGDFESVVGSAKPKKESVAEDEETEIVALAEPDESEEDNRSTQKKPPGKQAVAEADVQIPDLPEGEYDEALISFSKQAKAAFAKQQAQIAKLEKQLGESNKFLREYQSERQQEAAIELAIKLDDQLQTIPDIDQFIGKGAYIDVTAEHQAIREAIITEIGDTMDTIRAKKRPMPEHKELVKRAVQVVLGDKLIEAAKASQKNTQVKKQQEAEVRRNGMTTARTTGRSSTSGNGQSDSVKGVADILKRAAARV